jgi:hypothetical protein
VTPSEARGDIGAVPRPLWSDRWTQWTNAAKDDYFRQVAGLGPLRRDQVRALLQGHPPPPRSWPDSEFALDEHCASLDRFDEDVKRGAVSARPTPRELAAWADALGVDLPDALVTELAATAVEAPTRPTTATQGISTPIPGWVPTGLVNAPDNSLDPGNRKRGRPKTSAAEQERLLEVARSVMLEEAYAGQTPSLKGVVRQLQRRPEYRHKLPETIKRCLAGELELDSAKQLAAQRRAELSRGAGRER